MTLPLLLKHQTRIAVLRGVLLWPYMCAIEFLPATKVSRRLLANFPFTKRPQTRLISY
jgi:hypothetical protein